MSLTVDFERHERLVEVQATGTWVQEFKPWHWTRCEMEKPVKVV
jgi:hypothetical protein